MKTLLIDSSSAILLYKAGLFTTLFNLYQPVMAPAVYSEITISGYPGATYFRDPAINQRLQLPRAPSRTCGVDHGFSKLPALGRGEKETILLMPNYPGGCILIDDKKGARYCRQEKIPYINALLVPKILYYSGMITEVDCLKKMTFLTTTGRYSTSIQNYAFQCSEKELAFFWGGE